jgi:hypothetical protein
MAGLGETCSHIAAVLTTVVKAVDARKMCGIDSCTSKTCYWLPAAAKVNPANICDINFKSLHGNKGALDNSTQLATSSQTKHIRTQ